MSHSDEDLTMHLNIKGSIPTIHSWKNVLDYHVLNMVLNMIKNAKKIRWSQLDPPLRSSCRRFDSWLEAKRLQKWGKKLRNIRHSDEVEIRGVARG